MSAFRRSIAAVVGIDRYRHGIPQLENARNDARELGRILEQDQGYRVLTLTEDVTHGRILEFLDRLDEEVGDGDRLLFYFAGHGLDELYQRFVHDPTWQVITSAAHNQKANDALWGLGERGGEDRPPGGANQITPELVRSLVKEELLPPEDEAARSR